MKENVAEKSLVKVHSCTAWVMKEEFRGRCGKDFLRRISFPLVCVTWSRLGVYRGVCLCAILEPIRPSHPYACCRLASYLLILTSKDF